ncbi:zinc finger protein 334-like [Aricia agestis]|uniref:zinc finger protein 334-like n=1 Tax=Aricia agestis TaxID=91739 RepID=UPI001C201B39|nr:zinc finger protein 334-like [Aricia agestis]
MLPLFFMMNGISLKRRSYKSGKAIRNKLYEDNNCKLDRTVQRCRTCLGTTNLQNIFSGKGLELKRSNEFYTICGLDVKPDDGLPQKICNQCSQALEQAIKFRKTSRKSEKLLVNGHRRKEFFFDKVKKPKTEKVEIELEPSYDDYHDALEGEFYDRRDEEEMAQNEPEVRRKPEKGKVSQYQCNKCNKDFKMKATYKAHMRYHTNYCVCEACGKRCRNHYQLQEHKRAKHDLGKIHKCTYCEYSSATKEALTIHERRHTGERPYVCDHCGATFHRRSNLVQHIAIHNPDNNFQCDMCPKRLKSRKFLQIHKHNAHTGRRYGYLCGACGHRFDKPNKVRAHARRVHALPDERQPPVVRVQL